RMAEIAGPGWVARDTLARLVSYRGDAAAEWAAYGPHAREIVESFVAGVNACMDACTDNLPVEFGLMGIKPEHWTPEVCIGRMSGFIMSRNATQEVLRALLLRELGADDTARLYPTDPERSLEGRDLDLGGIDADLLDLFASLN